MKVEDLSGETTVLIHKNNEEFYEVAKDLVLDGGFDTGTPWSTTEIGDLNDMDTIIVGNEANYIIVQRLNERPLASKLEEKVQNHFQNL